MIKYKMVGSVSRGIRGSVCSDLGGSVSSGQVGSICAEFPGIAPSNNLGCIVNNNNANASQVFNCVFNSLSAGSAAYNDNYDNLSSQQNGLKFNCNKYVGNSYDVAVLSNPVNNPVTDIFPTQGFWISPNLNSLVRNLYSAACTGNENEYYSDKVSSTPINHVNNPSESGNGGTFITNPAGTCKDNLVITNAQGGVLTIQNACPTNTPTGGGGSGIGVGLGTGGACTGCSNRQILNNQISSLSGLLAQENAKLQAGSSTTLLAVVNNTTISNGDLKITLESQSPFLGDNVLSAYFSKSSVPPGHVKDIHFLNAPVSPDVWAVINNLNLPEGIKNQIKQTQDSISISRRTMQQGYVSAILGDLQYSYNSKVREMLEDTVVSTDSIKAAISNPYFSDNGLKLAAFYIDIKDYDAALKQVENVLASTTNNKDWASFTKMRITLLKNPKGYLSIRDDKELFGQISSIADNSEHVMQAQAAAIIRFATGKVTDEFTGIPGGTSSSGQRIQKPEGENVVSGSKLYDASLQAIPNPASAEVVINYILPQNQLNGQLRIIDVTGRELYKTDVINSLNRIYLSTKDWASGIYYYSLVINNAVITTKTLVITK